MISKKRILAATLATTMLVCGMPNVTKAIDYNNATSGNIASSGNTSSDGNTSSSGNISFDGNTSSSGNLPDIEDDKPEIIFDSDNIIIKDDKKNKEFINFRKNKNSVTFNIKVQDNKSNLAKILIKVNDKEIVNDTYEETKQEKSKNCKLTLDRSDAEDNKYVISVIAINTNNIENTEEKTLYIDNNNPDIDKESIKIEGLSEVNDYLIGNDLDISFDVDANSDNESSIEGVEFYLSNTNDASGIEIDTNKIVILKYNSIKNSNATAPLTELKYKMIEKACYMGYLCVYIKDICGNERYEVLSDKKVILDNENPNCKISDNSNYYLINNKKWIKLQDTDLCRYNYTINDNGSGIKEYSIKVNGNEVTDKTENNIDKTEDNLCRNITGSFSLNGFEAVDGKYIITVEVTDNAGNKSEENDDNKDIIYLDDKAPYIDGTVRFDNLVKENTVYMLGNKDVNISFNVKDDEFGSGIEKVEIYNSDEIINIDNATKDIIENIFNEDNKLGDATINNGEAAYTINAPNNDKPAYKKYLYAKLYDKVGNFKYECLSEKKLILEKNGPDVEIEQINFPDIDFLNKNVVHYKVIITDKDTGVDTYSVNINDKTVQPSKIEIYMDKNNILAETIICYISTQSIIEDPYINKHMISVVSKDNADNTRNSTKEKIGIDTEPPYIVKDEEKKIIFTRNNKVITPINGTMYANGEVDAEFYVDDKISGIKNVEIYALDKKLDKEDIEKVIDNNYKISSENVELSKETGKVNVKINSNSNIYKRYIYAKLTDNANRICYELLSENLLVIEKNAPEVDKLMPVADNSEYIDKTTNEKWINGKVIYNYSIKDDISGIADYHIYIQYEDGEAEEIVSNQNGSYDLVNNVVNNIRGTFEFTPDKSGKYTIIIKTTDKAGNTNEDNVYRYFVNADLYNPEIIKEGDNEPVFKNVNNIINGEMFAKNTVEVEFSVYDAIPSSGIKSVEIYAVNKKAEKPLDKIDDSYKISADNIKVDTNGKVICTISDTDNISKFLYVKVTDNTGNDSGYELLSDNSLLIDEIAPQNTKIEGEGVYIEPDIDAKKWINNKTSYIYNIVDNESGIKSYTIKVNGTIVVDSEKVSGYDFNNKKVTNVEEKFILDTEKIKPDNGKYIITIDMSDNAENKVENKEIYTVYYDKSEPQNTNIEGNVAYKEPEENGREWIKKITDFKYCIEDNESGIKSYIIKINDKEVVKSETISKSEYDFENEKITKAEGSFVLDIDKIEADNGKYVITMDMCDNTGNKIENKVVYTVYYDKNKPKITKLSTKTTYSDSNHHIEWNNAKSNYLYEYTITDAESGIQSYEIFVNGLTIKDYKEAKKYDFKNKKETEVEGTFEINPQKIQAISDGSYEVKINVRDNIGNTNSETYVIYKDETVPKVTGFIMHSDKYIESNSLPAKDDKYGYYFKHSTNVTVKLVDEGISSGISKVGYFLCKNGEKISEAIKNKVVVTPKNDEITITIPETFKGQIYVAAVDNVGNGDLNDVKSYVKPDSIIIDDNRNDKDIITINRPKTTYKDNSGLDLYNKDIPVVFNIKDLTSGIRSIVWNVTSANGGENNYSGRIDVDNSGRITGDNYNVISTDKNLITAISKAITVRNNDNRITVTIRAEDRAGNVSYATDSFSIDKTAPEINISYDNNTADSVNKKIFKADRNATISVKERNFNPKDVVIDIKNTDGAVPVISGWNVVNGTGNGDDTTYTANISYVNDGDYTFAIGYQDNADNIANINFAAGTVEATEFTIDKTRPTLSVQFNNNSAVNGNYYLDQRVATFTIIEHNFDASRFELLISRNNAAVQQNVNWTNNGDTHTASMVLDEEALYNIRANYTDMAGNTIDSAYNSEFYIDKKAPEIVISGIDNEKAYRDKTVGFDVSSSDTYFDGLSMSLELLNKDGKTTTLISNNEEKENIHINYQNIENGRKLSIENLEADGIYRLMCKATDKAGRVTENSILFSINRNGPTYYIDDEATLNIKDKYLINPQDIIFNEINVNELSADTIKITVYRGNTTWDLVEGKDYTVEKVEGLDKWCKYRYIISKDNFKENGIYHVTIASKDSVENDAISEKFSFVIDNEPPVCTIFELKDGNVYVADSKDIRFKVTDNIETESVIVLLNGKEIMKLEGDDIKKNMSEDGTLKITIPSSNKSQNLVIKCIDKSGNESETEIKGFYITTNLWIRFINNKPLVIGIGCAIVGIIVLIILLIIKKVNKRTDKKTI